MRFCPELVGKWDLPGSANIWVGADILCFGYELDQFPLIQRLPINIGTLLPELGVIPKKRAAGVSLSIAETGKQLSSYFAWDLAGGESASGRPGDRWRR